MDWDRVETFVNLSLPPQKKKKISPHCRLIELLTVNVWAQVVSYLTQNKLYLGLFW